MFLAEEVKELEKAGRIKIDYEIGLTRDGVEFVDRSKRILVLIDQIEPTCTKKAILTPIDSREPLVDKK